MRFIHTADIHLGAAPDRDLPWGKKRAAAIWNTFQKIIDTAGKEKTDLLLIAGDFFHRQPLTRELREACGMLASIPDTRVVIIAGNHDCIRNSSPYLSCHWPKNVTFLSSAAMTEAEFPEIRTVVHGFSYHRPEIREPLYDDLMAPKDGKYHILLGHGGDASHIPIRMERLASAGFDYVALGHIHQPALYRKAAIAYSGSPEPMDRTDMGQRGIILGECTETGTRFHFQPISSGEYRSVTITVNPSSTTAQIVGLLKEHLDPNPRYIYRITLKGKRDPSVLFDKTRIQSAGAIADINDETVPEYDLEKLRQEHAHDLIARMIDELGGPQSEASEQKALDYGLRALLLPDD